MNAKYGAVLLMLSVVVGCGQMPMDPEQEKTGADASKLTVSCTGLDYQSCVNSPYCQPRMDPCPLPPCGPNDPSCPVCSPTFTCVPKVTSHCFGLDERACNKTPGCQGSYVVPPCAPCMDPAVCTCPAEVFNSCMEDSFCSSGPGSADAGFPSWPDAGTTANDAGFPNRPDAGW